MKMLIRILHKIKYRGVAMVEYAVLLAFVATVGAVFLDDNGFYNGINSAVKNVTKYFLSFDERFQNNTSQKFTEFGDILKEVHDKNKDSDRDASGNRPKDYLNAVFNKLANNAEISFSELSDEQKAALAKVGLGVENFPNGAFYKDALGRWYATWSGEDLSKKKEGDSVKVITYSLSGGAGGANAAGFYVGEAVYKNGSITNDRIRYDTDKGMSKKTNENSTYNYYSTSTAAQEAYDNLK